ncbi:Hypothetical protein ABZS17H1_02447 [Kosakonia cowanii]
MISGAASGRKLIKPYTQSQEACRSLTFMRSCYDGKKEIG